MLLDCAVVAQAAPAPGDVPAKKKAAPTPAGKPVAGGAGPSSARDAGPVPVRPRAVVPAPSPAPAGTLARQQEQIARDRAELEQMRATTLGLIRALVQDGVL